MDLEKMTKAELLELLEDKELVVSSLDNVKKSKLTPQQAESSLQLRCRLCVGERYIQDDPDNPAHKALRWRGQPITKKENPCRSCVHIRKLVKDAGYKDSVYV